MANNIKIVPSSSLFEITGSDDSQSLIPRFDVSGSALNINYITPTSNDEAEVLKIKRTHPVGVEAGPATTLEVGYYGKSKNTNNLLYGKDIYTLQNSGSTGVDGIISYKKKIQAGGSDILVERKTPGVHEEFILSDVTLNDETFIKRTYVLVGTTTGAFQNGYLTLRHTEMQTPPNVTWVELNTDESAQITVRVVGRAGGTGTRTRAFLLNGYADVLDTNGTIAGNFALVNSVGQANNAPPNNWNVQLQFVPDYLGGVTNYIRIQVFNNSNVDETITWTAYVELIVNTSAGTARYGEI